MLVLGAQWQLPLASLLPALKQVLRNVSVGLLSKEAEIWGVLLSPTMLAFLPSPLCLCLLFPLFSFWSEKHFSF